MTVGEAAMGGRRTTEPYFALGGGVRGDLQLAPFASAVASIGLIVPVTQPRFILSDGTLIHQPQLGGSATLGVCLFPPRPVTKPGSANTQ